MAISSDEAEKGNTPKWTFPWGEIEKKNDLICFSTCEEFSNLLENILND